ncbi:MAG: ERCC4 domain-containing protein [archaeon]
MAPTLHDIFSKKLEKNICPNPKVSIIVDTREKQSMVAAELVNQGAKISFEKLEVGDYIVGGCVIERKEFGDFVNSMISKRLASQLLDLCKCKCKFLILEGFGYNYSKFNVHENAIRGMILSVAVDFGVPMIYSQDSEDTARHLILLAKKFEKGKSDFSLRMSRSSLSLNERKQFVLEGFPGIGPSLAKRLLEKFDSLEKIFLASEEELLEIEKFDLAKVKKFKEILNNHKSPAEEENKN